MPFNIRHWAWLARNGHIESPPMELGPFPFAVMTDKEEIQLHEDLKQWGILVENTLTDEAKDLLNAIAHVNEWTIRGLALLYAKKTNAVREFDTSSDEFGLVKAVRDVPRVPFSVTVTKSEVITAFSTLESLLVTRRRRRTDVVSQVGVILRTILDPEGNWSPWKSTPVSLPYGTVKDILKDKELSALILDDVKDTKHKEDPDETETVDVTVTDQRTKQAKGIQKVLRGSEAPAYTATQLSELAKYPVSTMVQMGISYSTAQGVVEPDASTGIMYLEGAGVVVSYARGRSEETRVIRYVPGDDKGFIEGVQSLVTLADPPQRR